MPRRHLWLVWGCAIVILQAGCTTLLTATGWQEAFRDSTDSPVIARYGAADEARDSDGDASPADVADRSAATGRTRQEADDFSPDVASESLSLAIERLAATGRLDDTTQTALLAALEEAPQQDWPLIINAFVASIESSPAQPQPRPAPPSAPPPAAEPPTLAPEPPAQAATAQPVAAVRQAPEAVAPVLSTSPLSISNACFASRVRGWGSVDRFASSRFREGQELIVYFELEHLTAHESQAGHTTRIDTTLQLVSFDGRRLHEWRFEPVEETCHAPRRDYFARYVLRIPDHLSATGPCRLDLAVTDAVARCTALASLPMEIGDRVE